MPFIPKIRATINPIDKTFIVHDVTGYYDKLTNRTGYGLPNISRVNIVSAEVYMQYNKNHVASYDVTAHVKAGTGAEIYLPTVADYKITEDGVYKFHPSKLKLCHQQCYHLFILCCSLSYSIKTPCLIIVDNTNIKKWEFMPYVQVAERLGFEVEYHKPEGEWDAELFAQRN